MSQPALAGFAVLSFESRRAAEIAKLVARYGATAISAPSMREVALAENADTLHFLAALQAGEVDIFILMTGVGTTALVGILEPRCDLAHLRGLLRATTVIARGPKPRAVLRGFGIESDYTIAEPNTWREILATLVRLGPLRGKRIAIQEYGRRNSELCAALEEEGARVLPVPVYRWALPEDLEPLRAGARALVDGEVDVAIFTSAQQCNHLFSVADDLGLAAGLVAGAARVVIASVGPICSAALRARGMPVDIEPARPKMGPLIREIAARAPALLEKKRSLRDTDATY